MALTRFFDDQIQSAVLTGSPITAGRGQFLALAGEFRRDNLRIFDMARVAMPDFNEYIGQQYNATPLTFTNDTDFNNYCTHLVCMSAADEPLFVIKLKNGVRLSPGQSFTIPEESIYTETFDFLQENSLRVFDTETLSYRAVAILSGFNASLEGSVNSNLLIRAGGTADSESSLNTSISSRVLVSGSASATSSVSTFAVGGSFVTVGTGQMFPDISSALNDASVVDGTQLLLSPETFVATDVIAVDKEVYIIGAGRDDTVITTQGLNTDPNLVFLVRADNTVFKNMTVRQLKPNPTGATATFFVATADAIRDRVDNVIFDNLQVDFSELGINILASNWKVDNCTFSHVGPAVPRRAVRVLGTSGNSFVLNSTFENSTLGDNYRGINFQFSNGLNPNEIFTGRFVVDNVNHSLNNLDEFVSFETSYSGPPNQFGLFVKNCTPVETSGFVNLYFRPPTSTADVLEFIVLEDNAITNTATLGMIGIAALGGATNKVFRNTPLPVFSTGNTLDTTDIRLDFTEAVGSVGSVSAYQTAGFNPAPEITLNATASPVAPTPPQTP